MADTPTPDPGDYGISAARKAGYNDREIADFVAERLGADIKPAREAGYPDSEILAFLAPKTKVETPEPTPEPRKATIADDFERGLKQARSSAATLGGIVAGARLTDIEAAKAKADRGEYLSPMEREQVRQYDEAKANTQQQFTENVGKGIINRREAEALPMSPGYKAFQKAEGFNNKLKAFWKAPGDVLTSMIAEGAVASAPALAAGLVAGPAGALPAAVAGGTVAGGQAYVQAYADKVVELLGKRGINVNNRDAVMAALSDPKIADEIKSDAALSAIPQAAAGAASMAVAPVVMAPARFAARPVAQQAVNIPAQAAVQGGLAAAGEAGSEAIIGEPLEGGKILAAGIGGASQGPIDATLFAGSYAAGAAFRARETARRVMDAPSVDAAIKEAQETVIGRKGDYTFSVPTERIEDVGAETANLREYGNAQDRRQAEVLDFFGGLNEGTVESAADGRYFYKLGDQTIPLQAWDPASPPVEGVSTVSPDLVRAQRDHYGKLGVDVVYFADDARIPFDGAVDPNRPDTLFLSNNPSRNVAQVAAHELTHVLERTTLPDGTNLGDVLFRQVSKGLTEEGRQYAEQRFLQTAPKREAFPAGPEGDARHTDAVTAHLIRELGADIGGEAPKFQTFLPKVIDEVQARYGVDVAKGIVRKLIEGIQQTMRTLREFFSRPEEMAEYGQPGTVSQKWVTNLEEIHGTLAKMYAERYGTQAEKENARLVEMRDQAQRARGEKPPLQLPAPAAVTQPPITPENVFRPETYGAREAAATETRVARPEPIGAPPAIEPAAPAEPARLTPEAQRPAVDTAQTRVATLQRWLQELDEKRRTAAPDSPQVKLLRATESAILRKVRGIEDRLTGAARERLANVRQQIDDLVNPKTDSPDMAKVREALQQEQQRLADAAAIGSGSDARPVQQASERPVPQPEIVRGQAVMSETPAEPATRPAAPAAEPARPVETPASRETAPAVDAPRGDIVTPASTEAAPEQGAGDLAVLSPAGREKLMRERAAEQIRWAVEEGGMSPDAIPEIARLFRVEQGEDAGVSFNRAIEQWIALEEARAIRAAEGDVRALDETAPKSERAENADTIGTEPGGTPDLAGGRGAEAVPERSPGREAGVQPAGLRAVPGEAAQATSLGKGRVPPRAEPRSTESKTLADAGEKIGGARKDQWAERGMRVVDLEGMTEGEAYQHTTKDAVWPKPDYAKMVADGAAPEAAALVKIIRDRLAARPAIDSASGRRNYVTMMGHVRDVLMGVKTAAELRDARDRIIHDLAGFSRDRFSAATTKEARDLLFSVYKGRTEPFRVGHDDLGRARKMLEAGFPAKAEPWTRRFDIRQAGDGTFAVTSKADGYVRRVLARDFASREEAENFARQRYEQAIEEGAGADKVPSRPHLDQVKRTGEDIRNGRNVTGDDFVKDFGFRGVEFGNWVASDERAKVVNLAYDALHDLANVLHVPVKALSLDGQLALGFGSRGRGGAAAHYEPGRLVINMTKLSGAGSLAHEWAHALDHHFGTLDTPESTRGEPRGASGWYDRTRERASHLKNLRPEMAEAFDKLMDAMFHREKTRAEAVRDQELRLETIDGEIAKQKERIEKSSDARFIKQSQEWIKTRELMLEIVKERLAALRDEAKPYAPTKVMSSYMDQANKLSGKSGEKGYWSRPTEMFARAFESYVFDKIKAEGNKSQYLVQGVEPDLYRSGYKGNPYPDAERPAINAAFDNLFSTMGVREGKRGPVLFSPRERGIPDDATAIATFRSAEAIKAHRDYKTAKAGDVAAASRLVAALVRPAEIERAREAFGSDVIYVPAIAEEASGHNAIPEALAHYYAAHTGAEANDQIHQANRVFHTGADAMQRMVARPEFAGPVEAGRRYVLVDDVSVLGGTLAEMANHIQARGGEVAGVVTLANASRSGEYKPLRSHVALIERRFGDEVRDRFGIEPRALTREEAHYLANFRDVDELRARASSAEGAREQRLSQKGVRASEAEEGRVEPSADDGPKFSPRQIETPEFKRWFGNSKAVDPETGEPAVLYHGTAGDFSVFDRGRLGHASGAPSAKQGFFFTSDSGVADSYAQGLKRQYDDSDLKIVRFAQWVSGGRYADFNEALLKLFGVKRGSLHGENIMPVYLSLKKPIVFDFGGNEYREHSFNDLIELAKETGADGVIFKNAIDPGYRETPAAENPSDIYFVFRPEQIKSAIGNRGTFDASNPDIRYSPREEAPPFFSGLTRAVEGLKMTKAPPGQWAGAIKNLPGVKPEERAWTGLDDWLAKQPKSVTKDEVLDYLRANEIQVREVMKGGGEKPTEAQKSAVLSWVREHNPDPSYDFNYALERIEAGDRSYVADLEGLGVPHELTAPFARSVGGEGGPKYAGYALPGGENYRELLLTLPDRTKEVTDQIPGKWTEVRQDIYGNKEFFRVSNRGEWDTVPFATAEEARAQLSEPVTKTRKDDSENYLSSHWDEPNVLAHIRFDDRMVGNQKVLHVAEVQSDWHQQGRKQGYTGANARAAEDRLAELAGPMRDMLKRNDWLGFDTYGEALRAVREENPNQWEFNTPADSTMARDFHEAYRESRSPGVPDAPFKTTWPELAMKRVIRYAAENGYDAVSWDTGKTNAERYDLSKHIKTIVLRPEQGGTMYHIEARGLEGNTVLDRRVQNAAEAAEMIGKEAADKLFSGENKERLDAGAPARLEGLDLKVGGEGMEAFYDKQLPIIANKIGKKFGAKVEAGALEQPPKSALYPDKTSLRGEPVAVHTLPITDAMRDGVMQGQPLFSPRVVGDNPSRTYTPEQIEARERIRGVEQRPLGERLNEWRQDLGKKLIREIFDPFIGLKERDPAGYLAARMANSVVGAVDMFNSWGTLKFEGPVYATDKRTGGPVALIRDLGKEAHDFIDWVAANRAERLKAEDRENLFRDEDIAALKSLNKGTLDFDYVLSSGKSTRSREAAYLDALKRLDTANRNALDLAVEAGLLKRKDVDALWSDPYYVPFYRQAEEDNSRGFVGGHNANGMVKQKAFERLKGGTEKLTADLWQNAFGNWAHMIDAAIRNKAANQVLEVALKDGIVEKVSTKRYEHEMTKAERADVVWTMVDGERTYWQVNDPFTLKAITALDYIQTATPLMGIARAAKRLLQTGVAASPIFQIRNLIRDTENAIGVSPIAKNVFTNLADGARQLDIATGLKNIARAAAAQELKDPTISRETADAIAGGATMRYAAGVDQRFYSADTYLDSPTKIGRFWDYFRKVGHASADAMRFTENMNRLALYRQLGDQGAPPELRAYQGRDLSDFTLVGASPIIRHLVEAVPYMNAWMQGLYKIGRAAADADRNVTLAVGGRVAVQLTKRLAAVTLGMVGLNLALDAIYADDEDYQNRTEYDRNSNFWFKVGGTEYRIPMGFEVAALARMAALWTETLYDKNVTAGRAWKNTLSILGTQMAFNPTPQIVKPLVDLYGNETRTGTPIETVGMERLRPEFRAAPNTTQVSRGVSEVLNKGARLIGGENARAFSPVQLDYLAQAYAGWLGTSALQIADTAVRALGNAPERPAQDAMAKFTGGLVANDSTTERLSGRYVNMLYQQGDAIREAYATYRELLKRGRVDEARDYLEANRDNILKHRLFDKVIGIESRLNDQIRTITESENLTGEQKRVRIMELTALKNRAARSLFAPEASP